MIGQRPDPPRKAPCSMKRGEHRECSLPSLHDLASARGCPGKTTSRRRQPQMQLVVMAHRHGSSRRFSCAPTLCCSSRKDGSTSLIGRDLSHSVRDLSHSLLQQAHQWNTPSSLNCLGTRAFQTPLFCNKSHRESGLWQREAPECNYSAFLHKSHTPKLVSLGGDHK